MNYLYKTKMIINEVSFTESDIPEYFYVAFAVLSEKLLEDLYNKKIYGITGISATETIMYQHMTHGGICLKMPAKDFLKINKVSKINYDNLDYLFSNNMKTILRLFNIKKQTYEPLINNIIIGFIDILRDKNIAKRKSSKYHGTKEQKEINKILNVSDFNYWNSKNINNFGDFVKEFDSKLEQIIELLYQDKNIYLKIKGISYELLKQSIKKEILPGMKSEKEWIVKSEYIKDLNSQVKNTTRILIPDNSVIIYLLDPEQKDNIDFLIKKSKLNEKYKIEKIPKNIFLKNMSDFDSKIPFSENCFVIDILNIIILNEIKNFKI